MRAFVHDDAKAMAGLGRDVLLRKAAGWSYEKEWRLITAQGLQDSPMLLKEVTFGLRCEPSTIHAVVRALAGRKKPPRFYQIYEERHSFRLRRQGIDADELDASFPRTAASPEDMFESAADS